MVFGALSQASFTLIASPCLSRHGAPGFEGPPGFGLGEVSEEVEGAFALAEVGGVADGFGDEVFGSADGFDGCVAEDEEAEERGGEGAAGAVGGGGFDVLAGEPVDIS
jgi:hypothetical protein